MHERFCELNTYTNIEIDKIDINIIYMIENYFSCICIIYIRYLHYFGSFVVSVNAWQKVPIEKERK